MIIPLVYVYVFMCGANVSRVHNVITLIINLFGILLNINHKKIYTHSHLKFILFYGNFFLLFVSGHLIRLNVVNIRPMALHATNSSFNNHIWP